MKTSHVLEVTAQPYSLGSPRIYYAKDYTVGDTVINSGEEWIVKEFPSGVLMFVCFAFEAELISMAKANVLKPSHKVRKIDGVLAGYYPVLKYNGKTVWQDTEWYMWRDIGDNSAKQNARYKILALRKM